MKYSVIFLILVFTIYNCSGCEYSKSKYLTLYPHEEHTIHLEHSDLCASICIRSLVPVDGRFNISFYIDNSKVDSKTNV